jgi:hypothetical protein
VQKPECAQRMQPAWPSQSAAAVHAGPLTPGQHMVPPSHGGGAGPGPGPGWGPGTAPPHGVCAGLSTLM